LSSKIKPLFSGHETDKEEKRMAKNEPNKPEEIKTAPTGYLQSLLSTSGQVASKFHYPDTKIPPILSK